MGRKVWLFVGIVSAFFCAEGFARAQSVTITFSTNASGVSLAGTGTSAVSASLGTVQAYGGTVPSGVTKTVNGYVSWSLSTPVDVLVTVTGEISASYTLTARIRNSDIINTWKFGSATLSSGSDATVTTGGTYSATTPYSLELIIPSSASSGAINNVVDFIAVSN